MSGRQRLNTQGLVPKEWSWDKFLCCPSKGWRSERLQGSINTTPLSGYQWQVNAKHELSQSSTTMCVYLHMTTPVIRWPIQGLLSCIIIADLQYVRIFQVVDTKMQFVCTFECTCMHMCNVCMQHMHLWNSIIISNLLDCVCSKEDSNATEICCKLCPNLWCRPQSILWSNWGALLPYL